ncbi:MAG: urea transporter [Bacteroidota bacterium]
MINYIKIRQFFEGVLNSYSQVFFSNKIVFSVLLIIISFFDIYSGLCGLIAILVSNLTALSLGFDLKRIASGLYGFNALLVGLGVGINFAPDYLSLFILIIISIFTFFLTVIFEGVLSKYNLPFLSLPFLLGIWTVTLATRQFDELLLSERGIHVYNELYSVGGQNLIDLYNWWKDIPILDSLKTYFMSLGAIFFQNNVLAGVLVALGLLLYSRIAFILSLIGFYAAFFFYLGMGIDIDQISYSYIGFNYILTAIALGGFFLVPNMYVISWTIILVPVVAIISVSSSYIFTKLGLPIYSLPFNLVVLMFLYIPKLRTSASKRIVETTVQHFSPEKNLYFYKNAFQRFKDAGRFPVKLPFMGTWRITQAHNGELTHKDDWRHAWDFEIFDTENKSYKDEGRLLTDYYCYDKPVIATLNGYVEEIVDEISDNDLGEINMNDNWGNTIIIRHSTYLFSKHCHLKPGSVKVKKGEYVKQGHIIASCGNSGRSPYPHLHFQMQAAPFIGAKTIDYPISNYILKTKDSYELCSFTNPEKDQEISNIIPEKILLNAFKMIPGEKLSFLFEGITFNWEIFSDFYNNHYIYCKQTNSYAYFYSDDDLFYFKNFKGKKSSLLYHFYLGIYKVQKGFYKNIKLTDVYPANMTGNKLILLVQDVFSPFYLFLKGKYTMNYDFIDDETWPSFVKLKSEACFFLFSRKLSGINFEILINKDGIYKFIITKKNKTFVAECTK